MSLRDDFSKLVQKYVTDLQTTEDGGKDDLLESLVDELYNLGEDHWYISNC